MSMRPSSFQYERAESLQEALQMLASGDAKALAGGHSLIPAMNLRLAQPQKLVDIGRLDELRQIAADGGSLRIGALTTHAQIAASADVQEHCPALASAASRIGDPQVRNWGTLGGNLAHADPASDPPAVVLAAGATLHLMGPEGQRSVAADDFFTGLFETDLKAEELLFAVEIPSLADKATSYVKLPHPASRYALVGICVILEVEDEECASARVAVTGAVPSATRSPAAELALAGSRLDEDSLSAAAQALMDELGDDVMDDLHAPRDYRRAMCGVYFKRAVRSALGQ
ncbi:MAG TPA: xanthine dehydrogenase family protein subunit M [Acidobacteriota bacterium]|nr:xanthine dehydrogenase family protein subunit M [Acidobacteriota bacterium]